MASEMESWRTALEFLPLGVVMDYGFKQAYRTGHNPYCEYALVRMDSKNVLCLVRGDRVASATFMTVPEAEAFSARFNATFLQAFRF